jgi:sugar O-acyltransferase (sialic acid O-acetyltransferase NeuD family)
MPMKQAIIGSGGFAREVRASIGINLPFFVDDKYLTGNSEERGLSAFDPSEFEVIVAIGDPKVRESIVGRLPKETKYFTYIHPSVHIINNFIGMGEGTIVLAGCVLSCGSILGKHTHLNFNTVIGHDVIAGDYLTTAPNVGIMGNNTLGDRVYFGVGSSTKEKITICSDVTIGLGAGVVKSINQPGTYIGLPCQKVSTK